jgi:hypothetical protein
MQAWGQAGSKTIAWTRMLIQMEVSGDLEVTDQIQATIGWSKKLLHQVQALYQIQAADLWRS